MTPYDYGYWMKIYPYPEDPYCYWIEGWEGVHGGDVYYYRNGKEVDYDTTRLR